MKFVVDASVAVKWYVPEAHSAEAEALLDPQHELSAPELIYPEFGNIIWKKVARKEITEAEGRQVIAEIRRVAFVIYPHLALLKAAYTGARLTDQTVYDWTYLALAVTLDCEFVTADERFYRALEKTKLKKNLRWVGDLS